jgi:hypothetical protein
MAQLTSTKVYGTLTATQGIVIGGSGTISFANSAGTLTGGLTIVNPSTTTVPLTINGIVSTTASIQEWRLNNNYLAGIDNNGWLRTNGGMANANGFSNSNIQTSTNGVIIARNVTSDTQPTLIVRKQQGTGNILELQTGTSDKKFEVDVNGWFYQNGTRLFVMNNGSDGLSNLFFGRSSGSVSPSFTGYDNTGIGRETLSNVTSSSLSNTALGDRALRSVTTGSGNVGVGRSSGRAVTTGSENTFIGSGAGNTGIGQLATASNSTAIGYESFTDKSNQMVFGNASVTEFKFDRNTSAVALLPNLTASSSSVNVLERTSSSTNTNGNGVVIRHTTTGDMVDGFGSGLSFDIKDSAGVNNNISLINAIRSGADNSGRLAFATATTGTLTEKMTILPNGNVGIGTSNPSVKLFVAGNANIQAAGAYLNVTNGSNSGMKILTWDNNVNLDPLYSNNSFRFGRDAALVSTTFESGNVGIGTANPSNKLHVVGNTRIEGNLTVNGSFTMVDTNTSTTEQMVITNDGTGPALIVNQVGAQPVVNFQDDGTSAFYIADGGNVGIGTTSPLTKLDVRGDLTIRSTYPRIDLTDTDANQNAFSIINDNGRFNIYDNTVGVNRLSILASGNVGLGIGTPAERLDVFGNAIIRNTDNTSVELNIGVGTAYNTDRRTRIKLGALNDSSVNGGAVYQHFLDVVGGATGKSLTFNTITNGATETERMRITSSGNVGIGTTNPGARLDIVDSIVGFPVQRLQNTSASGFSGTHFLNNSGGLMAHFGYANASVTSTLADTVYFGSVSSKPLVLTTSDTERVRVTSAGNVGIGTTSPSEKLEVIGSTKSTSFKTANWTMEQDSTTGALQFNYS